MNRYSVNLRLDGFNEEAQLRLRQGRLLIVGCGALGGTAAMYASASGVGKIGLMDFDTVDISNLQRQVFYREQDAGKAKATLLAASIRNLNSDVEITEIDQPLTRKNAQDIISGYDIVIDAADNPATTALIEEVCGELDKCYVTAGVDGYHAQIMSHLPGTADFSDFFPSLHDAAKEGVGCSSIMPCSMGVFGPLTGVVASLEAAEAVKILSGVGTPLSNSLLRIDLRTNSFQVIKL